MTAKEAANLNNLKAEIKKTWANACLAAGVPVDSKFVVFEASNNSAALHNCLMNEYFKAVKRIKANENRRARHAAHVSCGLTRVYVNGQVRYE